MVFPDRPSIDPTFLPEEVRGGSDHGTDEDDDYSDRLRRPSGLGSSVWGRERQEKPRVPGRPMLLLLVVVAVLMVALCATEEKITALRGSSVRRCKQDGLSLFLSLSLVSVSPFLSFSLVSLFHSRSSFCRLHSLDAVSRALQAVVCLLLLLLPLRLIQHIKSSSEREHNSGFADWLGNCEQPS